MFGPRPTPPKSTFLCDIGKHTCSSTFSCDYCDGWVCEAHVTRISGSNTGISFKCDTCRRLNVDMPDHAKKRVLRR